MPHGAGHERGHAGAETGLLPLRSHPEIDVVPQPIVGIDVPRANVRSSVLCKLQIHGVDVDDTIPLRTSGLDVESSVADAGQDASTFREYPDTVVFASGAEAEEVQSEDSPEKAIFDEFVRQ